MLAVVGMCGGAGATTVAYLTAAAAAIESSAPVLLADFGGPSTGLAAYSGAAGGQSFCSIAAQLSAGTRPAGTPFSVGEFGMRLLAGAPEIDTPVAEESAIALLAQARSAHGLTVLDCGQLTRPVERVALGHATHVAWVLPATTGGLRRGRALLGAVRKIAVGREVFAARSAPAADRASLAALADLADERAAPLLLIPRLGDLADTETVDVLAEATLPLQALGGALHR